MKIVERKERKIKSILELKTLELFVMEKRTNLSKLKALAAGEIYMVCKNENNIEQTILSLTGDCALVKRRGPILVNPIKNRIQYILTEAEGTLTSFEMGTVFRVIKPNGLSDVLYMIVKDPTNTGKFISIVNLGTGIVKQTSGEVFGRVVEATLKV